MDDAPRANPAAPLTPTPPRPGFLRELLRTDRVQISPIRGARDTVAIIAPVAVGAATGALAPGLIMAVGALNASFLDTAEPRRVIARRMLAVSVLGAFAAATGAAVGGIGWLAALMTAAWAFAGGLLVAFGPGVAQVGVTSTVLFVVFSGQAVGSLAPQLGLLILGGGLLQTLVTAVLRSDRPFALERRALAGIFGELAGYAARRGDATGSPPASASLLRVSDLLTADGARGPEREALWALVSQAERARLELSTLAALRDHLATQHDTAALADVAAALPAAGTALSAVADALRGDRQIGPIPDPTRPIGAAAEALLALPDPFARAAAARLDALSGQVRAALALAVTGSAEGLLGRGAVGAPPLPMVPRRAPTSMLRANLTLRSSACRHALRIAALLVVADLFVRAAHLPRGYWVVMTAAFVLQPNFAGTLSRGGARLVGTGLGLAATTLLVHVAPAVGSRVALLAALTFIVRLIGPANIMLTIAGVTGVVVVLLSLFGYPAEPTIAARAVATVIGGAMALAAYALWPTPEEPETRRSLSELFAAYRAYFDTVTARYQGAAADDRDITRTRLAARLARTNAEASVERLLAEPGRSGESRRILMGALATSHRFAYGVAALEFHARARRPAAAIPQVRAFIAEIDRALRMLADAVAAGAPPGPAFPDLRAAHRALAAATRETSDADLEIFVMEADRMANTLNTVALLLTRAASHTMPR